MKVIAELQNTKHNRVWYDYAATARGKPGKRTRCRSFMRFQDEFASKALVRVELSIDGSVKMAERVVDVSGCGGEARLFRKLVRDAAENPEQWL